MTAKLADHERWRRELSIWIAESALPEAENLRCKLIVTEDLIRWRRKKQVPWPAAILATLEQLCFHRWEIMTAIARLKNGNRAAPP